jgi:hypothetical protein
MGMDPDVKKWKRQARRAGWRIRTGGPHEHWLSPDGITRVTVSGSTMKTFSRNNLRAQLRRAGLTV